ncbi:MAG TPA: DUF2914 domain-containing protein [Vicinamibacterales bacterium]|nr:DUF2914 domain-containing protein [Vicinamibacterales bacterium]
MTHVTEPGTVLAAAEEAAENGDLATAERLLREALALQEANLGPKHADLAETLNNLAVVCERQQKFGDAEQNYRRAHAIAIAALKPGDPKVATSLKNLVDFCVSRGIPIWMPPAAGPGAESAPAQAQPVALTPNPLPMSSEAIEGSPALTGGQGTRRVALVAVGVAAVLTLVLFAWRTPGRPADGSGESAPPRAASASTAPAPTPAPATATAPAPGRAPATTSAGKPAPPATSRTVAPATPARVTTPAPAPARRVEPATSEPDRRRTNAARAATLTVLTASVCRAFENRGSPDWQCTPANGSSQPGVFTFYTRIQTAADTTVEHRWYRDGRLHQNVRLAIRANAGSGYRTYSRATISPDRAGNWRVELRAADGTLLKEERLVVR